MLIEKTGRSRYIQGTVVVCVTRTDGKEPDYAIRIRGDEILDLEEEEVCDLFQILNRMVENEDVKPTKPHTLTAR